MVLMQLSVMSGEKCYTPTKREVGVWQVSESKSEIGNAFGGRW